MTNTSRYHKMNSLTMLTMIFIGHLNIVSNENILVVMPLPARSHFTSFRPLFEELVKRGHNLTIISIGKLSESLEGNYTLINVDHLKYKLNFKFADLRSQNRLHNCIFTNDQVAKISEWTLQESSIQSLLSNKNNKFDLVVMELFYMDVFVALGYFYNTPVVALSAQNMISYYSWITGDSVRPSYVPNAYLPLTNNMSLLERFLNTMFTFTICLYHEFVSLPEHQRYLEAYFPIEDRDNIPKVKDMLKNISLVLVNAHFTFGYPKPTLPHIIQIAGLHITEPSPLPENIQEIMDAATDGVIYISLGSLIDPKDIELMGTIFLNALRTLPQKIILKWNPKLFSSIPDNFFIQQWLPQTSILKHPNCRLFITHGGLHSLLEAVKFSVPIIGVPFFTDQQHNIALTEYYGMGKELSQDWNETELVNNIKDVLSTPKYYVNMKRHAENFNDRVVPPLDTAVYWVEYVLRQKDLPFHLKPASTELHWYQYYLLDVISILILMLLCVLVFLYSCVKFMLSRCRPTTIDDKTKIY